MTFARHHAAAAIVAALAACGCLSVGPREPATPTTRGQAAQGSPDRNPAAATFGENVSFAVDRAALRARGASPELLAKIDASPYRYFRLLGPSFAARTCFAFRDLRWRLPSVAVHGDAHVEQFVVTRTTYGIEDFDQAGYGPAIVDLVRYAASVHVACRKTGFRCDADRAVAAYFTAYREALDHPIAPRAPGIVQRLRQMSPTDTAAWLGWIDAQIRSLPAEEEAQYRRSWARFVMLLTEAQPQRPAARYEIARLGRVEIGVGSALEKKVLARTRGASDDPTDDLIFETRLTTRPTGNECVWRPPHGGSLHVILFTSLLGRRMPEVFGFMPQEQDATAPEWWVQSWEPGYRELSIADIRSQADLEELAADTAHQLGGHFWNSFPEPLRQYLRFAQLQAFDLVEARARRLGRELADEVAAEWERFRSGPAATQEWPVYRDGRGRFEFRYPSDYGTPQPGSDDGFRDRVAAVRFPALTGLGGEAALTKGRVLVDLQAVGGLYDDISLQVFPEPLRGRIEQLVPPLTLENFCASLGQQDHLPASLPFEPKLADLIRSVDRTRNDDPRVVQCVRAGGVITFHKEATFVAGTVNARQQLYGAIRFLPAPYSSFQFVRGALVAPSAPALDAMTRMVQSFTLR